MISIGSKVLRVLVRMAHSAGLGRWYLEPQNVEQEISNYEVFLIDIVLRTPHPASGSPVSIFNTRLELVGAGLIPARRAIDFFNIG